MADLTFDFGDFSATTVTVEAATKSGLAFLARHCGAGATSIVVRKSGSQAVYESAKAEGLTV